jgi:hypothetical protein
VQPSNRFSWCNDFLLVTLTIFFFMFPFKITSS